MIAFVIFCFNLTFILSVDIYVRAFVNLEPSLAALVEKSDSDFSPKLRDKIHNLEPGFKVTRPAHTKHSHIQKKLLSVEM